MRQNFNNLVILSILLFPGCLLAQKKKASAQNEQVVLHQKIYSESMHLKDYPSARNSVYYLKELSGTGNWTDTLATLFLLSEMPDQAIAVSQAQLSQNPDNKYALKIKALSEFKRDSLEEAERDFNTLIGKEPSVQNLIFLASLQCSQKKHSECVTTIDRLQNHKDYRREKVLLQPTLGKGNIPAEAATIYLQAVILRDMGQMENAVKLLNEALEIYPDFELAREYQQELNK